MTDIKTVLELAFRAAGDNTDDDWGLRVITAVGDVMANWNEHSLPWHLADTIANSKVFFATYRGAKIEASSKRYIVSIQADNEDEPEQLRTERFDGPLGQAMVKRLEGLEPGQRVRIWKYVETITADKKVRILAHIERLGPKDSETALPPGESRGGAISAAPQEGAPQPVSTSPAAAPPSIIAALDALTAKQRAQVAKECAQQHQIFDVRVVETAPQVDKVMAAIDRANSF